jgi:hypothetical protein
VSLLILSLRIPLFVPPNEVRGPSALACLGKTLWEAVTPHRKARGLLVRRCLKKVREVSLCLAGQADMGGCIINVTFQNSNDTCFNQD